MVGNAFGDNELTKFQILEEYILINQKDRECAGRDRSNRPNNKYPFLLGNSPKPAHGKEDEHNVRFNQKQQCAGPGECIVIVVGGPNEESNSK